MAPQTASSTRTRGTHSLATASLASRARSLPFEHPSGAPRRPLRAVSNEELALRLRRRRARAMIIMSTLFLIAVVCATVLLHVFVDRGQLRLDQIKAQVSTQAGITRSLETQVAHLETPARVVQRAGQLGMVAPHSVTYLKAPKGGVARSGVGRSARGTQAPGA